MSRLFLATSNPHKTHEVTTLLGSPWQVEDMLSHPGITLPEETGTTFEENAIIKAKGGSAALPGVLVMADDSGLEVDALDGQPGVYSARYAGENATDAENRLLLKERLRHIGRNPAQYFPARFYCCLALVRDGQLLHVATGTVEGWVSMIQRGKGGFGYDSMFYPEGFKKSFAELSQAEKNTLSHRGQAIEMMKSWLDRNPQP